ncbi:hypothetical protein [Sphingobium sp. CAP-1]|uniref:hypothetical protein n=1 Tax=Sphingobium sp. CAP-1 TaxID=2676077 RepID=UPI0012BB2E9D|nr:hypothetical protein [Sphingobium sp. CAP-1]QGP78852.1 hypothetical protein GL174_07500 [Sphingobium sp. CAP-1]
MTKDIMAIRHENLDNHQIFLAGSQDRRLCNPPAWFRPIPESDDIGPNHPVIASVAKPSTAAHMDGFATLAMTIQADVISL